MNTRHIQSFLIVSAAFFSMTGPVRAQGASALAAAGSQMRQIAAAQDADAQPSVARVAAPKANVR
ncbi:hypothetical protein NUV26_12355 [Burkholderia pseudomultivorans]|uniref:Membrane protein n=2 Tax=Burkholderia cepacia complex TaxID=87882 RepID=A0A132E8U6_9BURK|nr:hypothetical protein [Burkholderia pseudomultivorans]AIO31406.1 hypothetical protein DM39_125 [Burkholderia cenocepacia]EGD02347.1 putative outer membrane protein [Burkholderia sp. TJI49]AOI90042.1 hypothetical protein WS57_14115 [Burkholderia pseudomultivorans]KVC40303.1 hypothetical protein WS58_19015 [Burkholderia pseudomultivorans]KVG67259.1 hypothetical protein WS80_00065 [Burkholderia pseudomultivorans]